ncbi:MAG: TRC40/GET3/ArsA family transport-energizing ATPase [Candidatus Methanoperedens sp.]|nr:TRC40/GET3/ArsA family transport-energizing ATPase [Candidatus Methanoperedens sp.]MCZ7371091.1 TRC40/GET3/ArsA family transport-energizing ATPase [Candidatus Methanoperedens sp.]
MKYLLFAGKGGLGKTTLSATTARYLASKGKKVIVFSTDPQASLTDVFEQDLFGKGEVQLVPNLFALEIDADRVVSEYQASVRKKILDMYGEVPEEIEDYIKSASAQPAMSESATFDSMIELIMAGNYDYYIFDMMPHGHAIRFLSMASLLDVWINKVVDIRKDSHDVDDRVKRISGKKQESGEMGILEELQDIKNRLGFMAKIIGGRDTTALFYVVIPEQMAILDTEIAIKEFKKFGIELSGIIVNQVYPRELRDDQNVPDFLKSRVRMQQGNMEIIREKFGDRLVAEVPMMDREPKGLAMLEKTAGIVYG